MYLCTFLLPRLLYTLICHRYNGMYREYYGQGHLHRVQRQDHEPQLKLTPRPFRSKWCHFFLGAIGGDGDHATPNMALEPSLGSFNRVISTNLTARCWKDSQGVMSLSALSHSLFCELWWFCGTISFNFICDGPRSKVCPKSVSCLERLTCSTQCSPNSPRSTWNSTESFCKMSQSFEMDPGIFFEFIQTVYINLFKYIKMV